MYSSFSHWCYHFFYYFVYTLYLNNNCNIFTPIEITFVSNFLFNSIYLLQQVVY